MTEVEFEEDQPGESPPGTSGQLEQSAFNAAAANHTVTMRKLDLGLFGQFVGSGGEKAGNIAGITIVAALVAIFLIGMRVDLVSQADTFIKLSSPLFALITLSVGYLFGAGSKE